MSHTRFASIRELKGKSIKSLVSLQMGGKDGPVVNFVLFERAYYTTRNDGLFRVCYEEGLDDRENQVCELCTVSRQDVAEQIVEWLDTLHREYSKACKECKVVSG